MTIIFSSHNNHKISEIQKILPENVNLLTLKDLNFKEEIDETASTLAENAFIKARAIYHIHQLNCFADDSGLEADELNGAPGVYSARYAGLQKNNEDNISKLLSELKEKSNRKAQFKTVIALIFKGKEYFFEGIIRGTITTEKRGTQGFGYDPVFMPDGYDKTFAEMSPEEKNAISHRAIAVNKLVDFLKIQQE